MNTHQPYPRLTRTVVFFLAALAALAQSADPYPRISEEAYKARLPFFDYSKDIPLEARIVRDWDSDTTLRQKIVFRGAQGFLVPGYIEIPKHAPKPCALVLLLHGWSGGKENWWEDGNYVNGGELRKGLLDDGSAVLALDAPAHGERCSEIDYLHVNAYTDPNAPTKINYFNFTEIAVQTVRDYRRTMRAATSACAASAFGYSMGGMDSIYLLAVEPRIKMAVTCVPPIRSLDYGPSAGRLHLGREGRTILMLMGERRLLHRPRNERNLQRLHRKPQLKTHLVQPRPQTHQGVCERRPRLGEVSLMIFVRFFVLVIVLSISMGDKFVPCTMQIRLRTGRYDYNDAKFRT